MRTSKPCKTCSKFLKEMGIGEICYFDNGKFVSEKLIKKQFLNEKILINIKGEN